MAEKTRRVQFYLLSMSKKEDGAPISKLDLETRFKEIIDDKMIQIPNTKRKAVQVDINNDSYVIEFIKQKKHALYLELGVKNPSSSVALRDQKTLASNSLRIGPTQNLEIYTFCIIDFETRILSYVEMNGSPRVSIIKDWINNICIPEGYSVTLSIICSKDILKALSMKKRITRFEMDLAIPSDTQIENLGVTESSFDNMRGKLSTSISYVICAERGKSLFDEPSLINKSINKILDGINNDNIKAFRAYGKDDDDINTQVFNLLEYEITISEKLDKTKYDNSDDEERMDIIYKKYTKMKPELSNLIRT